MHLLRVQTKELRAALRLLHDLFPPRRRHDLDGQLGNIASGLADFRDRTIVREQLEPFLADARECWPLPSRRNGRSIAALTGGARRELQALAKTFPAAALRTAPDPGGVLRGGLRRGYKRAHAAWSEAREAGDTESYHRFRKKAKYLFLQLQWLASAGLPVKKKMLERLNILQQDLGKYHDLVLSLSVLKKWKGKNGKAVCKADLTLHRRKRKLRAKIDRAASKHLALGSKKWLKNLFGTTDTNIWPKSAVKFAE